MLPIRPTHLSVAYLKEALANGDTEKLIRFVRLHLGDGDEAAGRREIDKAWIEALKLLLDVPPTDRDFILSTVREKDPATHRPPLLPAALFPGASLRSVDP